jgi:hypothetical protein
MTSEKPRVMLATLAVLATVGLQSLAAAQETKVVPGNVVKTAKPRPVFERPQSPAALGIHGFSIVLVVGSLGPAANASDTVPQAASKALADMKDFLPYKRYQLLDAAWILCCAPNTSQVSGRVRGPDGRDYLYTVDPGEIVGSKLNLRFVMREVQSITYAQTGNVEKLSDAMRVELLRQQLELARERDEAESQLRTARQKYMAGHPELELATERARRAQQRLQEIERLAAGAPGGSSSTSTSGQASAGARGGGGAGGGARNSGAAGPVASAGGGGRGGTTFGRETMDSSFSISPGETVVIGTSRINGDQALIAILTAATKPGVAR